MEDILRGWTKLNEILVLLPVMQAVVEYGNADGQYLLEVRALCD